MPAKPRIAIIGAGSIGLEAALYARLKGYEVTVYERGRIAENIRQWGHVTMFSPFGMNSSEWGRGALSEAGVVLPREDSLVSGTELVNGYLLPLSRLHELANSVFENVLVESVTRRHSRKAQRVGDVGRGAEPFRILIFEDGLDMEEQADVVLDCSGTFGNSNWIGAGGAPCLREQMLRREMLSGMPDILGEDRDRFENATTLVVGSGHSAATNVIALARLAEVTDRTRVVWLTQTHCEAPVPVIQNDRLPERQRLAMAANELATNRDQHAVDWRPGYVVNSLLAPFDAATRVRNGCFHVKAQSCTGHDDGITLTVGQIIANVGYRPDRSLYEELQVHECYATQGPMKLAAKLLGETSTDCLDQISHGPESLRNPEPNFYILGMKSYGRNSNFLIQVGLQQIVDVFTLIEQDWG